MRTFSVFYNADVADPTDRVRFVKEGIAWWALIAPLLWFLYHRLWWEAAFLFGLSILIALAAEPLGVSETSLLVFNGLFQVLIACEANDLRGLALRRKGFRQIAIAHGVDEAEAEVRFFAGWDGRVSDAAPLSSSVFDRSGDDRVREPAKAVWPKGPLAPAKANPDHVLGLFPNPPHRLT